MELIPIERETRIRKSNSFQAPKCGNRKPIHLHIVKSDDFERNIPNLLAAKRLILIMHNMFSFMDSQMKSAGLAS